MAQNDGSEPPDPREFQGTCSTQQDMHKTRHSMHKMTMADHVNMCAQRNRLCLPLFLVGKLDCEHAQHGPLEWARCRLGCRLGCHLARGFGMRLGSTGLDNRFGWGGRALGKRFAPETSRIKYNLSSKMFTKPHTHTHEHSSPTSPWCPLSLPSSTPFGRPLSTDMRDSTSKSILASKATLQVR